MSSSEEEPLRLCGYGPTVGADRGGRRNLRRRPSLLWSNAFSPITLVLVVIGLVEVRQCFLIFCCHFASGQRIVWVDGAERASQQCAGAMIDGAVGFDVVASGDRGRAVTEESRGVVGASPAGDDDCPGASST